MSAISCTVPAEPLYSDTVPFDATGTVTRFATVLPASKLRLDVSGRAPPPHTAIHPKLDGRVTVTCKTAADTPDAGTPPRPSSCSTTVPCGSTVPACGTPVPSRVSSTRAGVTDVYDPGAVDAADAGESCTTTAKPAATRLTAAPASNQRGRAKRTIPPRVGFARRPYGMVTKYCQPGRRIRSRPIVQEFPASDGEFLRNRGQRPGQLG